MKLDISFENKPDTVGVVSNTDNIVINGDKENALMKRAQIVPLSSL